jgi:hypothetical protein
MRRKSAFSLVSDDDLEVATSTLDQCLYEQGVHALLDKYGHPLMLGEVHHIARRVLLAVAARGLPTADVDAGGVVLSHRAPRTSQMAARRVMPRAGSRKAAIVQACLARGDAGCTDSELEEIFADSVSGKPAKHQSISAGRNAACRDGWLIDSGLTRKNAAGFDCIAWIVPETLREAAREQVARAASRRG